MDKAYPTLVYENAAGGRVLLTGPTVKQYFEVGARTGFTAPEVNLIREKYVNGNERIVNRIVSPRIVTVTMIVTGKTEAMRDKIFSDMVDVLMDTTKGEVGKLYVSRSDGRTVILNCAYSSGLNVREQYKNFHYFTLEFYAADPYFYTLPIKQTLNFSDDKGFTLSDDLYLSSWRLGWGIMSGNLLAVNRTGGVADPIYEISGTRMDLMIRNASARQQISFHDMDMDGGDVLVIDTRPRYKSAYFKHADGTVSTALGYLVWSAVSLSLPMPEGNSYIIAQTFGENKPLEVSIMTATLSA